MTYPKSTAASTERVYLDHAAATPVHEAVREAMQPYLHEEFGNPGALHQEGRAARAAVDTARTVVATELGIKPAGVVFTSGGTESNNLAIIGYLRTLHAAGRAYSDMAVLTTPLEHPATAATLAAVQAWGVAVREVPVDEYGRVHPATLAAHIDATTVLVTVALINSEIGVLQSTQKLARILRKQDVTKTPIKLHVDAAQAPLWHTCRLDQLGADLLSLDAGKCGGPKGAGVLALARSQLVQAGVLYGGGQESGLRPGTEAVAQIVGTAEALQQAAVGRAERVTAVTEVRDALLTYIEAMLPEAVINGPIGDGRVANNINLSLPGYDTEFAATVLDQAGFAVSTKSACSSSDSSASAVVLACTDDGARARSTIRITLGPETSVTDGRRCIDVLADHVTTMRPYRHL